VRKEKTRQLLVREDRRTETSRKNRAPKGENAGQQKEGYQEEAIVQDKDGYVADEKYGCNESLDKHDKEGS
jgi:hypothetical protein